MENLNTLFGQPNICSLSTFRQSPAVKNVSWDFPGGPVIKNPYTQRRGIWVQSLGREDPLEEEMATHSSILAWEIPWTGSPVGYSPWGCKESDTT